MIFGPEAPLGRRVEESSAYSRTAIRPAGAGVGRRQLAGGKNAAATGERGGRSFRLSQEAVVVGISVILFAVFSIILDKFLTEGNVIALLKNVSILGTLAVGMGFVVVGRGDLAPLK